MKIGLFFNHTKFILTKHKWNLSEAEAILLQQELAQKVIQEDQFNKITYIAGVDVAYQKKGDRLIAAMVVLDAQTLAIVEESVVTDKLSFPYIPGLFSFRELPPIVKAYEQLSIKPDLVVCDGQGFAHPRRFGLACHFGVLMDIPTIGCGKTRLTGSFDPVGEKRGDRSDLIDNNEVIGQVLRTQNGINPLYVSIGHKVQLDTACKWVLHLCQQYRQPETTRMADQLVNKLLKENEKEN